VGLIYLDSCILIYAFEDGGPVGMQARRALAGAHDILAVSPLVLHECLIMPLRTGDIRTQKSITDAYRRMIQIDLDEETFIHAAELRARYGLRAQESLHLAAADLAACDQFWTNDKRLVAASQGFAIDVIDVIGEAR
jgi:predicted nucleic acid-binding protein